MEIKRQTAVRTRISDLLNSKFVRKEGMEPSYIITDLGIKISRAKIIGTIIDKFYSEDGNFSTVTIADDTGSIRVKAFQEETSVFDAVELGDTITVIGKVREYAEENYLIPEILKKLPDPNYETLHKLEVLKSILNQRQVLQLVDREKDKFSDLEELKNYLIKEYGVSQHIVEGILETLKTVEPAINKNHKELVIESIQKLDKGKGVDIKKLIEECKLPDGAFEEVIGDVLNEGICYESSPGIIKLA